MTINSLSTVLKLNAILVLLSVHGLGYSQAPSKPLDSILFMLENGEIEASQQLLRNTNYKELSTSRKALFYLAQGSVANANGNYKTAYDSFIKVKQINNNEYTLTTFKANEQLIYLSNELTDYKINVENLVAQNSAIASKLKDPKLRFNSLFYTLSKEITNQNDIKALKIAYKMKSIAIKNKLLKELEGLEVNIGTLHYYLQNADSSRYYYSKALQRRRILKDTASITLHLNNYARIQLQTGDPKGALKSLEEVDLLLKKQPNTEYRSVYFNNKADIYESLGQLDLALENQRAYQSLKDSLQDDALALEIANAHTKYQSAEKEKQNAILRAQNSESKNNFYFVLFLFTLAAGSTAVYITYKNRKEKLLISQNEAQKQREITLMKEQELAAVDAMIAGQERERKRIARELHDDLGSNLTTIKLYLENAQEQAGKTTVANQIATAYGLLNDTYEKVRSLSHAHNGNALGENSLINAIEQLTSNLNRSGKIAIEFIHYRMDKRLTNVLEISIFRTVQELFNNIVKHSKATEASISLTQHDYHLDITVVDNGIGFNPETVILNMGYKTIEDRIDALNGCVDIDSSINKGTTINIEIPLI